MPKPPEKQSYSTLNQKMSPTKTCRKRTTPPPWDLNYIAIEEAITVWKRALEESDPENKKARIDKDVTIAIYFNLLEAYFLGRNTADAESAIKTLKSLGLSNRDKRTLEQYEELFLDLTLRKAANGL
jgi:hypothetical protein